MSRISPSGKLAQLAEGFRRESDVDDLTGVLVRLGARKLMQERLEVEGGEFLGRDR